MKFSGKTFADQEVALDGNQYYKCRFNDCVFVYAGGAHPFFDGCHFDSITLKPVGDAWHILLFWKGLQQANLGGLVDATFNMIRGIEPPAKPAAER
jgi:hypothetical protein